MFVILAKIKEKGFTANYLSYKTKIHVNDIRLMIKGDIDMADELTKCINRLYLAAQRPEL